MSLAASCPTPAPRSVDDGTLQPLSKFRRAPGLLHLLLPLSCSPTFSGGQAYLHKSSVAACFVDLLEMTSDGEAHKTLVKKAPTERDVSSGGHNTSTKLSRGTLQLVMFSTVGHPLSWQLSS